MNSDVIVSAIKDVTKRWSKQRQKEERRTSSAAQRNERLSGKKSKKTFQKTLTYKHLPNAYLKASGGGRLPVMARQLMYAVRALILEETGQPFDGSFDSYFTQVLLPNYQKDFVDGTSHWKVNYDKRGVLLEPHTGYRAELGTAEVERYIAALESFAVQPPAILTDPRYPTLGPKNRSKAILFIEKEGFLPLLQEQQILERYDLCFMSTKGLSTVASRRMIDVVSHRYDVPVLVLHDFDKSGFSIVGTLSHSNHRYEFENDIDVIDLGIRLDDVREYGLQHEAVSYKSDRAKMTLNLQKNGATDDEIEFLLSGKRVELNAFTSDAFIQMLERKLEEHGIEKVIPDGPVLEDAFRRAHSIQYLERISHQLRDDAEAAGRAVMIPRDLEKRVKDIVKDDPSLSWDQAVMKHARKGAMR